MKIIGWRVWYADGTRYSSKENEWSFLPDDGLQIVVLYKNKRLKHAEGWYRSIWSSCDYYWTTPKSGLEVFCSNERPQERYPGAVIKYGKWMPVGEFEKIRVEANASLEF